MTNQTQLHPEVSPRGVAPNSCAPNPHASNSCAEFIAPDDRRWGDFLASTTHDFYHLPEYVALEADQEGGTATAFYAEHGGARLLIPLLLRTLPPPLNAPAEWRDAVNPYGYPSPLFVADASSPQSEEAQFEMLWQSFCNVAAAQSVVGVFLRLHPLLLLPPPPLEKYGQLVQHGQTVYFDLADCEESLDYLSLNHRRDIKKLAASGFQVVMDDWSYYPRFIEIYRATMARLQADQMYYFEGDYFMRLRQALGERLHLATVIAPSGEIAGGALITTSCGIVQYHLAGTDDKYHRHSPAKLLMHRVRDWSHGRGEKLFHLGGGLGGREDSLFRFKAGFSKRRADFFTYRLILDSEKYQQLIALWQRAGGEDKADHNFFPAYRRALL
jgi:hypothetical protein